MVEEIVKLLRKQIYPEIKASLRKLDCEHVLIMHVFLPSIKVDCGVVAMVTKIVKIVYR